MTARIPEQDSRSDPLARGLPTARLLGQLPDPLAVGEGTAILLEGTLEALAPPSRLRIRIGGLERAVDGLLWPDSPGELRWWAVVPIPSEAEEGIHEVALVVEDDAGAPPLEVPLAAIRFERALPAPAGQAAAAADRVQPLIAICMAAYEPRFDWLVRQLDSIRAQSWENWICLISDDGSSAEAFAGLERAVGGDPRFVISQAPERLGFYANFERALRMIPPEAELIALADQDDRWDPDKLEALQEVLVADPAAALAYSDMRIATEDGRIISETFWYLSRNRYDDIASLMVINMVTGAASLFRRELLEIALPFPPSHSNQHYHDHWIALCALASGPMAYLDRPTYDYTRHEESVTLRATTQWFAPPRNRRDWLSMHWRRWTRRLRMGATPLGWRAIYFDRYLMIRQFVMVLELRIGPRMDQRKRRGLSRLERAERSPSAAAWLLARTLRPLIGRNETLGRERVLFGSLLWRWSATARGRLRRTR